MLIDCGSFRNSGEIEGALEKIADGNRRSSNGAPIDVVVGTHQHNDHVSGFAHCERGVPDDRLEQVWLSWLDNPREQAGAEDRQRAQQLTLQLSSRPRRARTRR